MVIETSTVVMVADKASSQDVKHIVATLKKIIVKNITFIEMFIDLGVGTTA